MEGLPFLTKRVLALPSPLNLVRLSLPQHSSQRYYNWAEKLFDSRRFEEALDAYTECLNLNSSNENALYKRGLTYGLLKNMESSLSDLSSVLLQRFLKEAHFYKQNILETKSQEPKETAFLQAIPESCEFFEAISDFKELAKTIHKAFVPLFTEQEYEQYVKETLRSVNEQITNEERESPKQNPEAIAQSNNIEKVLELMFEPEKSSQTNRQKNETHEGIISLCDVQGLEKVKESLCNKVVLPMKRPDLFAKYKKKRGSAILLYGPPGCGKTMLIRALAGETGSDLVIGTFHELFGHYFGDSQRSIHNLFEDARSRARNGKKSCIIFLDELDAMGINRGLTGSDDNCHRDVVDQLLMELDGIAKNPEGLFIIAASNRPWGIDPALKRSGRIGECIYIPAPLCRARKELFQYYVGTCASENLDFDKLAEETGGCSAADIEAMVEEAKMQPILRENETGIESSLCMKDFEAVLADPVFGKGTLKDYYVSVARELTHETMDSERYKPMIDDIKKALQRGNAGETITPSI